MVTYMVNGIPVAGGFPLKQRTIKDSVIPLDYTAVMITSTQDNCPAPIALDTPHLQKGMIFALPNTSLRSIFQTASKELMMCPYISN